MANTLTGNAADNTLSGLAGIDTLVGNGGSDLLDGGADADTLKGGAGDDVYVVDDAGDVVIEITDEGTDTVQSSITVTLAAHVENLILTGAVAINGTGNALANTLTGNAANNSLDGGTGADVLQGGWGDDLYRVDNIGDTVKENAGAGIDTVQASVTYTLSANVENLTLTGTAAINGIGNTLANTIIGNAANNTLNGGTGADTLEGGLGNDLYVVDNVGDSVVENSGEGTDTVRSSVSYTLAANIENLTLLASANLNGTGNGLDNILLGNTAANMLDGGAGNDLLDGGTGADTLKGGAGDDSFVVDDAGDVVLEDLNQGVDLVQSAVTFTLSANVENLTLTGASAINGTGNDLANTLLGNSASNTLDGGTGADVLKGGLGDDVYVVDNAGDSVTENSGEGTDTVFSSVSWNLAGNIENLTLTGVAAINGTGNELANTLIGNLANNSLDGGIGADVLRGGLGDDIYVVDNIGDTVAENTGEGTDSVQSSVAYSLAANIENLTLTGTAAINGIGNTLANTLVGNIAANTLNGRSGADILIGGLGNDFYVLDNVGDSVVEQLGEGTDTVQSSLSYSLGAHVENLILNGAGATNGTGNELANTLKGNGAANLLDGKAGADTLTGGLGSDTFMFGTLVGGADKVTDFVSGTNKVPLLDGVSGLSIGNGDHVIDNAALVTSGGFANTAELVIVSQNLVGGLTTTKAASMIGSATSNYALGDSRLFVVDNGKDSALFLFKSADANALVSGSELTLIGTLQGAAQTALADYGFA